MKSDPQDNGRNGQDQGGSHPANRDLNKQLTDALVRRETLKRERDKANSLMAVVRRHRDVLAGQVDELDRERNRLSSQLSDALRRNDDLQQINAGLTKQLHDQQRALDANKQIEDRLQECADLKAEVARLREARNQAYSKLTRIRHALDR